MSADYWTLRYGPSRVALEPVTLSSPLRPAWRYKPKGSGLAFVNAGAGAAFTTVGKGIPTRLNLKSGRIEWIEQTKRTAAMQVRWAEGLLVFGDNDSVRLLDLQSGAPLWSKTFRPGLGVPNGFLVKDVFVGDMASEFHAIDLYEMHLLWAVPKLLENALVSDGRLVLWYDGDVVALDLLSGKEVWRRPEADFGGRAYRPGCVWNGWFIAHLGEQLTALDVQTGKTVWRVPLPVDLSWWHPYDGRAYVFWRGVYMVVDLYKGRLLFEKALGPTVPEPVRLKKRGLTYGTRGAGLETWRNVRLVVSETHAFLQNYSGQIVVLKRDTGEIEQVVEIDAMPTGAEPVIYEGRLLLTDFNATVHCFAGAGVETASQVTAAERPRSTAKGVKRGPSVKAGSRRARRGRH